jgi:hypothetical protein
MGIKDNAKAQFSDILSGELYSIYVAEWKDTIYYKAAINGKKQSQILKLYDQGKTVEAVCMALIMRGLNKDGEPVWRTGELNELMHEYDTNVISRIVEQIADNEPTVDEAKKP